MINVRSILLANGILFGAIGLAAQDNQPSEKQLERWLKRFPEAVTNHPLSCVVDKNNNLIGDHHE